MSHNTKYSRENIFYNFKFSYNNKFKKKKIDQQLSKNVSSESFNRSMVKASVALIIMKSFKSEAILP